MIKCAYLNMSQLYIHIWTSGRVADVLHQLMGILIKTKKNVSELSNIPVLSGVLAYF